MTFLAVVVWCHIGRDIEKSMVSHRKTIALFTFKFLRYKSPFGLAFYVSRDIATGEYVRNVFGETGFS